MVCLSLNIYFIEFGNKSLGVNVFDHNTVTSFVGLYYWSFIDFTVSADLALVLFRLRPEEICVSLDALSSQNNKFV